MGRLDPGGARQLAVWTLAAWDWGLGVASWPRGPARGPGAWRDPRLGPGVRDSGPRGAPARPSGVRVLGDRGTLTGGAGVRPRADGRNGRLGWMTGHVYNIYGCTHIYIYIYSCTHHLARETTGPALAGRTTPPGTARGLHEASTKRAAGAGGTRRYGSGGVMVSVLGGPPRLGKLDLARTTTPPGVPWDSLSGHRTTARTLRTQSGKEGLWEVEGKTSVVCWRPARFSAFPAWKTASPSAVAAGFAFVAAPPPRTGAWSQPPIVLSPGRGAARLPRVPWVLRSRR